MRSTTVTATAVGLAAVGYAGLQEHGRTYGAIREDGQRGQLGRGPV